MASVTWTDWTAPQSTSDIVIASGEFQLAAGEDTIFARSGSLTSETRLDGGAASKLTVTASVPSGTRVDVTVLQDTSGGTAANYVEQVTNIAAGTEYPLSNFAKSAGSSYWLIIDLSGDGSATPTIDAVALTTATTTTLAGDSATVAVEPRGGTLQSPTAPPDAPTLSSGAVTQEAVALSWTDADRETGYVVEYRPSGGSYTQFSTPDADVTSETVTGLVADTTYDLRVGAVNGGGTAYSNTVTVTTNAATQTTLAGDSATVSVDPQSGALSASDATVTFAGEAATVAVEPQAGTLLAPVAIAPPAVTITNTTETSVTLAIDDNGQSEESIRVERRREYSDGFGDFATVASLAANTADYTDSAALPSSTYEYRVSLVTTLNAVAAAPVTTTTGSLRPANDAPASSWYVEIDTPAGTRTPAIVGTPQRDPSVNGLEQVTIPAPKDDAWDAAAFEDATVRVYHDGERLPVDTLIERRQTAGRTELVCEGPTDLYTPDIYEFSTTDVHAAFQTVASDAGLAVDVEPPESDNRLFATIDTENDFRDVFQDPGDATPVTIRSDGTLEPQQTCWVYEGENHGNASTSSFSNGDFAGADDFSITLAEDVVPDLAEITQTFTTERELPSDEVGVKLRWAAKDLGGEFQVELDGQLVYAELNIGNTDVSTQWFEAVGGTSYETDQTGEAVDPPPTLSPGDHTITIRNIDVSPGGQLEPSTGIAAVDLFAVYDKRYTPSFPVTTNSNDALAGPSRYPTVQPILLHEGFLSATGGRFEGVFTDLSGPQEVAISNDYGSNYTTASNTDTIETDFASPGADIQLRVTLGSYGGDASTPAGGQNPQALDSYELRGDTRNSPPLTNDQFEGDRADILTALVERGDALWAAEWDRANNQPIIRMANVGDLTSDRELDLVDYEWSTQTLGRQVERATVKGGAESVAGETVTADVLNGNPLDRENLIVGRERVRSASTGERYRRGTDYEMNYVIGQLNPNQNQGNISDGEDLEVDYEYKPEGDFAKAGWDDRNRLIETFVDASTDAICQSIAFYLVERLGAPVESGTLTIPELPAGYSVVEAIAADPLPNRAAWTPRGLTVQQGRVELEVASRRRVQDVVSDLQTRLDQHGDRI